MARTDNFKNFATDVADSIRSMTGKTGKIPASQFDTEIKSIETKEDLDEELNTYNTEVTEQGVSIDTIINLLEGKAVGGGGANDFSRLPEGYQEIATITSTGTQYIDTGVNASSSIKIEVGLPSPNLLIYNGVLYGGGIDWQNTYIQGEFDKDTTFAFNNDFRVVTLPTDSTDFILVQDSNKIYANDKLVHTFAAATFSTDYPIYLFTYNRGGTTGEFGSYTISYCKVYDNGELVRDFVPCYKKDNNEAGLFDLVNNTFHSNKGSDSFVKGENITTRLQTKDVTITSTDSITILPDEGYNGMSEVNIAIDIPATIVDEKVYSTEERVIGKWVDNKPLYRKTFIVPFSVASGVVTITRITHKISNIQNIFVGNESYYLDASGNSYAMNYCDVVSSSAGKRIRTVPSYEYVDMAITNGIFADGEGNAYITLYYTKSTDTASNDDLGTINYSNDEQSVGTDEEGNVIYEKVITATPSYSPNGGNKTVDIAINVDNATHVRLVDGFWYGQGTTLTTTRAFYPLNFINTLGDLNRQFSKAAIINNAIRFVAGDWITTGRRLQLYAKIRYRKVTN